MEDLKERLKVGTLQLLVRQQRNSGQAILDTQKDVKGR